MGGEVLELLSERAERMEREGYEQGREQGREEGREQGREEGRAETLEAVREKFLALGVSEEIVSGAIGSLAKDKNFSKS